MKYEVHFNCCHCGQSITKTTTTSGNSKTIVTCQYCKKRNNVESIKDQLKKVSCK